MDKFISYIVPSDKMPLFTKSIERIRPIHGLLTIPFVAARMAHQIPIMISNTVSGIDTSKPRLRNCDTISQACDIAFEDDNWFSFQCIMFTFDEFVFTHEVGNIDVTRKRLETWNLENFGVADANIIEWANSATATQEIFAHINQNPPSKLASGKTHLCIIDKSTNKLIIFIDHYCCDGSILFDLFTKVLDGGNAEPVKPPPFPTYKYYPLLTDTITAEMVTRLASDFLYKPSLIREYNDRLSCSSTILYKKDNMESWGRWNNYGECILRIFERMEGNVDALGATFYTGECCNDRSNANQHPVDYLRIALSAGIKTDCSFGNNRIGAILLCINRPNWELSRQERIDDIANQFKIQCTRDFIDAISSYDLLRGYDIGWLRNYLSANTVDVVLTSFKYNRDVPQLKSGFGGFFGTYKKPYLYVNSITTNNRSLLSYTTNLWSTD